MTTRAETMLHAMLTHLKRSRATLDESIAVLEDLLDTNRPEQLELDLQPKPRNIEMNLEPGRFGIGPPRRPQS